MRRQTLLWWLAGALIAGIGANCGEGSGTDPKLPPHKATQDTRSKCPNIEFHSPDERCLTLQTYVESRLGPYEVLLNISGGNGAYPPHVPIAAGGWTHALVYRTGVKMMITMTLELQKPGSKDGFCSITDGSQLAKDTIKSSHPDGGPPYIAVCVLTTNQ
jgi:hypothetical protein